MTITVTKVSLIQGVTLMRRAGYALERARDTGEISFARRVHGTPFPRYHAYTEERNGALLIKLHLDQKAPSYGGSTPLTAGGSRAHAGEYAGETLGREVKRIEAFIEKGGWESMPDMD